MKTRAEIRATILRHLVDVVDGLEDDQMDCSRSMKDYGATSLDMVEVVSASMREMRIKVPRSELNGLRNLDELIDLFADVQQRDAQLTRP